MFLNKNISNKSLKLLQSIERFTFFLGFFKEADKKILVRQVVLWKSNLIANYVDILL